MNLEQFTNEVKTFIEESHEMATNYQKMRDALKEEVDTGMRGSKEANLKLDETRKSINDKLFDKSRELKDKKEKVREVELKRIEETSESITTDAMAELNMLADLDISGDEFKEYVNKYKHNPLAIKKLQEISMDKRLLVEFPPDRKQYLNVILGRIDTSIGKFALPNYSDYGVKNKMVSDGAIGSHLEDVSLYKSL